ncbi:MAG: PilN domain-containing protein [Nitrospinae bacterium]|nr:PilN domain-containing protein [Nitrospinota bacterium]
MRIFGIDIGTANIKVAVVEKRFRGHEVRNVVKFGLDTPGKIEATLSGALRSLDFDPAEDHVAAVFPADKITSRSVRMPFVKARQISDALPFELESLSPFDADDFVCAWSPVEVNSGITRVLGALALKSDMAAFIETLKISGADPDWIIPSQAAISQSVANPAATWALALEFDNKNASIVILKNGAAALFHTAPVDVETILSHDKALKTGTGGKLESLKANWDKPLKKFANDVSREIKMAQIAAARDDESFTPVKNVIICGEIGNAQAVGWALEEELGFVVERVDSSIPMTPQEKAPVFAAALGAAVAVCESMDSREKTVMNLRTGQFAKKKRFTGDRRQIAVTGVLLAILLAAGAISYISGEIRLGRKYDGLKTALRAEFKRAMPEVTNIVSEIQQMKSSLKDMENRAGALGPALAEKDPFLDRLGEITSSVPENTRLDTDELTYEWGKVSITGRTESFDKVELYKKRLEKLGWVKKAAVEGVKASATGQSVDFKISLEAN